MDSRLLQKYISGNATEEEARKVTLWISQSDEHRREYIAKRKLFDIYLWRDPSIESTKRKNPNQAHPAQAEAAQNLVENHLIQSEDLKIEDKRA